MIQLVSVKQSEDKPDTGKAKAYGTDRETGQKTQMGSKDCQTDYCSIY